MIKFDIFINNFKFYGYFILRIVCGCIVGELYDVREFNKYRCFVGEIVGFE